MGHPLWATGIHSMGTGEGGTAGYVLVGFFFVYLVVAKSRSMVFVDSIKYF